VDNSEKEPAGAAHQAKESAGEAAVVRFKAESTEETFIDLVRLISPRMLRYFQSHGVDPAQTEDLLQDVLVLIFRNIRSLRDTALFWAWSYKIARNVYLQHIRKSSIPLRSIPIEDVVLPTKTAEPWQHGSFGAWMQRLDPVEQDVLILRFVEDMEYQEIAEALDIPIGTVKWRIFQAKKKLLKYLPQRKDEGL